jgi:hypothetical protein
VRSIHTHKYEIRIKFDVIGKRSSLQDRAALLTAVKSLLDWLNKQKWKMLENSSY